MHRLALIPLVFSSVACVASSGDEGFEILHNLAPSGTECKVTPGGAVLPHGIIEASSLVGYLLTPELSSRITQSDGNTESQRTISLRGANVVLTNASSGAELKKFKALFSGSLPPGGMVGTFFEIIPADTLKSIGSTRTEVLAKVTPFGVIGGTGDTIDGVPFYYPVTVCDAKSGQPCVAKSFGACPLAVAPPTMDSANGCNQFQDGAISCCTEANGDFTCPPTISTP